jgi:hypothetical protein
MKKITVNDRASRCLCRFFYLIIGFVMAYALAPIALAQGMPKSNQRQFTIPLPSNGGSDSTQLDTLCIVPHSVRLWLMPDSVLLDTTYYQINEAKAQLKYNAKQIAEYGGHINSHFLHSQRHLYVQYRVFNFAFHKAIFKRDMAQIQYNKPISSTNPYNYGGSPSLDQQLFSSEAMTYKGSIGRGISFGSAQDMVVNSNFNIQMSGKIAGDIAVLAAITDNNIPFQPEGNTQQLQEFDQIFVQLKRKSTTLLLGDYYLKRPDSYFMNFTRRLQGLQLDYLLPIEKPAKALDQATANSNKPANKGNLGKSVPEPSHQIKPDTLHNSAFTTATNKPNAATLGNSTASLLTTTYALSATQPKHFVAAKVAAAIAKGNYHRIVFSAAEGNQGPYKLIGANGETFIIVISGSERVFIDGKQMIRGYDADYIIDYNTAEISFTTRQIITKDRRISIEFEYADRYYLRSTLYANMQYQTPKYALQAHLFSEQDAKNQPLAVTTLSDQQKLQLRLAGNDFNKMLAQSADSIGFMPDRILYRLLADTTVAQQHYDSVFVYSTNPNNAHYSLSFTYVGEQQGNYKIALNAANGRVYEWVAPDSISLQKQGNYEPIIKLVAPLTRQMATLAATWLYEPKGKISAEIALANNDPNALSDIDNQQNNGIALKAQIDQSLRIGIPLQLSAGYEYKQAYFKPLEPYRNIEFGRDWNLNINPNNSNTINSNNNALSVVDEHITTTKLQYSSPKQNTITYDINTLQRDKGQYKGIKQIWTVNINTPRKWSYYGLISYLYSQNDTSISTHFLRPNFVVSKLFKNKKNKALQVTCRFNAEQNRIKRQSDQTLQNASFAFHQTELVLQTNSDTTQQNFTLKLNNRYDYALKNQQLKLANNAQSITLSGAINQNAQQQLTYQFTYRQLHINDSTISLIKQKNTYLLGNVNYNAYLFKQFLRLNTLYQIGTGQKQRTEIYYQKVPTGTGNFIWRDNNNDNIEQPDEFEVANANDIILTNYIQIALPTTQYQSTNNIQYTQNIQVDARQLWKKPQKWQKYIALLSVQTQINLQRETLNDKQQWTNYLPFKLDSLSIIGENTHIRHTLFLNRNQPKWEFSIFYNQLTQTNSLLAGTDTRYKKEMGMLAKYSLSKTFTANINSNWGSNAQQSTAFVARNFNISFWNIEPALTYLPNKYWRLSTNYKYKQAQNTIEQPNHKAIIQQLSADTRYGIAIQSTITAKLSYILVQYEGNKNNAAAYTLLDGFQVGNNYQWAINFDTTLPGGLQLNLSYDGRKNNQNPVIHTGRASLRAVF